MQIWKILFPYYFNLAEPTQPFFITLLCVSITRLCRVQYIIPILSVCCLSITPKIKIRVLPSGAYYQLSCRETTCSTNTKA